MNFGYVRVSTIEQNLDLQIDALEKAGCEKIFKEKISGAAKVRPEYEKMISLLRKGDTVTVWKIDRLGRTTLELIKLMVNFGEIGVNFKSITEGIDTASKMGKVFYMLSSIFAENEREVNRERTRSGLDAARARGRYGGRPKGLTEKAQNTAKIAASLYSEGVLSTSEIMEALSIKSRSTLYRYLRYQGVKINSWIKS